MLWHVAECLKRRITTAQREARRQTSYLSMKPLVLLLIFASSAAAAAPPVGRDVDIIRPTARQPIIRIAAGAHVDALCSPVSFGVVLILESRFCATNAAVGCAVEQSPFGIDGVVV